MGSRRSRNQRKACTTEKRIGLSGLGPYAAFSIEVVKLFDGEFNSGINMSVTKGLCQREAGVIQISGGRYPALWTAVAWDI